MLHLRLGIITSLALVAGEAGAQPEVLSWAACVQEASQKNPQLAEARHTLARGEYLVTSSESNFYPQITATANATRTASDNGRPTSQTSAFLVSPDLGTRADAPWISTDEFSFGLSLKQSLVAGFKDRPLIDKRGAELSASQAALGKAQAELAYDLRTAFYTHLYAQKLIALTDKVRSRRTENVRLVNLRFEGGRENKGSVLKSRASLAQAQASAMAAERALTAAQAQLAKVLGRPRPTDTRIAADFIPPHLPAAGDFVALSQSTPAVREASALAKASAFDVASARAATYPDVSAVASATRSGAHWAPDGDRLALGIMISVPLYTGGKQTADMRAAAADQARAEAATTSAAAAAINDLAEAYTKLADAAALVGVQEQVLTAAELQAEISRSQYSLGLATFQEWDQIESNLSEAERALLNSQRDAALAAAQWEKALGHSLAEAS